jgi:hypothetical protein
MIKKYSYRIYMSIGVSSGVQRGYKRVTKSMTFKNAARILKIIFVEGV